MDLDQREAAKTTSTVPYLVVSKHSTLRSDTSLSPSEFDRMINANFPQVLAAADDIGFETMRSDTTNVTSTGLNTLYLQAKSTSTPSLLAELSLSESTKKAINNLERCLQDIGPESGIGISPADFGELGSGAGSNRLAPPSNDHKWSLNSSLEIGEEEIEDEEACHLSLYTTPDNRVERQLYFLDGNRRSSFESVYSPPVVSEQVVNEVLHVPSPKATVLIQDETANIRPVKDITPPPRFPQRAEPPPLSSTSVTTSISDIISSPPSESAPTIPENDNREIEDDDDVGDGGGGGGGACSTHSEVTLGGKEEEMQLAGAVNQSEASEVKSEHRGLITTVVTVPLACGGLQSNERAGSEKITPRPRTQTVNQRSKAMESSEDDYEWARKIQEIAQWQADVDLAMQNGVSNGSFIQSPGEETADDSLLILSEPHRPTPLKRRNRLNQEDSRPTMVTTRTFECNPHSVNGNKLENMRLLQPATQHGASNGANPRNDMFSRRFGVPSNSVYNRTAGFPKPLPIPSGNGPELTKSSNYRVNDPIYHVVDPNKHTEKGPFSPKQVHPKVNVLVPNSWNVETKPSFINRENTSSFPRHELSGYAEALSLATAANHALSEAFRRRGGGYDSVKQAYSRPLASQANDVHSYQQMRPNGYREAEPLRMMQPVQEIPSTYLNGHHAQPEQQQRPNVTSFNGTGRITIPARSLQPTNGTTSPFRTQTPIIESSSKMPSPQRTQLTVTPSPKGDFVNRRSPNSSTLLGSKSPKFTVTTRSRSVGPTSIPPPPPVASAYPLVTDLAKGLKIITANDNNVSSRVQALPPKKFILGRVASNEDICIETETPFAFSIAAKGKQICIAKVASADDLQRPLFVGAFSADLEDKEEMEEGIPVSLRLTFGSTPCVSSKSAIRESSLNKTFRSVLHIDMSTPAKNSSKSTFRQPKPLTNGTSLRNSLPSLPKPPKQCSHGANVTYFEQDIW